MVTATDDDVREIRVRLSALLREAAERGVTFTVDDMPLHPLRMGNKAPRVRVLAMTETHQRQLAEYLELIDAE